MQMIMNLHKVADYFENKTEVKIIPPVLLHIRSDISKLRSESPKTTEARNVLLKEIDENRTKLLSENGANKAEIEAQYLKEKRFIETSSPQEVFARRQSIERLNKRYETKIKKAFDKELNSRIKKIAGAFEKQGKSISCLNLAIHITFTD